MWPFVGAEGAGATVVVTWGLPICACSLQCPQVILIFNPGCTHFMTCWVRQTPLMVGSPGCMTPRRLTVEPLSLPGPVAHDDLFSKTCTIILCCRLQALTSKPSQGLHCYSPWELAVLPMASPPVTHMAELCGPLPCSAPWQPPCPPTYGLGAILQV